MAQQPSYERPRLVIGITVDGLRADYLSMFWNELSKQGIKKIIENGAFCQNVGYSYEAFDKVTDFATFSTGAEPYLHGIVNGSYYDRQSKQKVSVIADNTATPIAGTERVSSRKMLSSTVADELQMNTMEQSTVISLAMDSKASILQVGHLADAVLWIDDANGNWSTSSSYANQLPSWVKKKNEQKSIQDYMKMKWDPLFPINYYVVSQAKNFSEKGFSYSLKDICKGQGAYKRFKQTPFANTYLRELAVDALSNESLGKDVFPDMLLVNFSLNSFTSQEDGLTVELEDAYLRLDNDIKMLLEAAEQKVGRENLLVYVVSTRAEKSPISPAVQKKIPGGIFNSYRYMSLLNTYLMAIYGQENWVSAYDKGNIYLNRQRIDDKGISLREIQDRTMEFVSQIPGVMSVSTSFMLEQAFAGEGKTVYPYNKQYSGDLILSLYPGWTEVDKDDKPIDCNNTVNTCVPIYFYGWKIKHQRINSYISAINVATTLSGWLQISNPNANRGIPIPIELLESK